MKKAIVLIITAAIIFISCSKSKETNPENNTLDCSTNASKTYASDISFIIQSKCATDGNCHGSGSMNGPGALLTYSSVFNARVSIRSAVESGEMPLTGSLTTEQKNSLLCWIDRGAPNN